MKRWERWSKIIFMGALLAEFLLPSPSAIVARWSARLSQHPTYTALFAAMTTQDFYTPDLLGIDGVVGTAVGVGADGGAVVLVYTARPGVPGPPLNGSTGTPVRTEVTGEFWALGDGAPCEGGAITRSTGRVASLARCRSACPEASRM